MEPQSLRGQLSQQVRNGECTQVGNVLGTNLSFKGGNLEQAGGVSREELQKEGRKELKLQAIYLSESGTYFGTCVEWSRGSSTRQSRVENQFFLLCSTQ